MFNTGLYYSTDQGIVITTHSCSGTLARIKQVDSQPNPGTLVTPQIG